MAVIDPLPASLVDTLARFPSQGERNVWLFTVAAQARHIASSNKVRRFLLEVVTKAGWRDRDFTKEIERAVRRTYYPKQVMGSQCSAKSKLKLGSRSNRLAWPACDEALWNRYVSTSPIFTLQPIDIDPESVIDALYPESPLVCMAKSVRSAVTQERERWRGMESLMQYIVANPMAANAGRTQDGRLSHRCHDNAAKIRTYQVVEFDRGTLEQQAAILSALHSDQAPLVMVVYSGGKSLHGWYDVSGLTESDKIRFFSVACRLGADSTLWDPCKLVRMPGGRRSNGKHQPILYISHNAR